MSRLYDLQQKVMKTPWFYWLVNVIVFGAVIYGFFWYKNQLSQTPLIFWLFTPDCPGAAFLFLIWVVLEAYKLPSETFKVIAVTALIKYGIWTVSVIGLLWFEHGIRYWQNVMLFVSHAGMILLGVTFAAKMKISRRGLIITSGWLILNDFVDYYFQVYPWLPDPSRLEEIRLGTFILTGLIILWMVWVHVKGERVAVGERATVKRANSRGMK